MYMFVFADWLGIPPEVGPSVILLITPAILFLPLPVFYWRSRLWFIRILVSDVSTNKMISFVFCVRSVLYLLHFVM